ncbi:MAG TPA: SGNH/GDSL hydrolase family protein, partial [Bacillota bacterium]|nr:SGNH/GDSL hydrolase family protein [Bacillota bacterium]
MKRVLAMMLATTFCVSLSSCTSYESVSVPDNSSAESKYEMSQDTALTHTQKNEAVVCVLEEWRTLRFSSIKEGTLIVSSGPYGAGMKYTEGTDYTVDYKKGTIKRTVSSRIPDFSKNSTYNAEEKSIDLAVVKENFHALPYTVYVTYDFSSEGNDTYEDVLSQINTRNRFVLSDALVSRINEGGDFVYAVVGDSISTGCEASKTDYTYFNLFARYLESLNPDLHVRVVNVAVGGLDSTSSLSQIRRLYDELGEQPDLVSIAFGMNDQNSLEHLYGVSPADFVKNHKDSIALIKEKADEMPEIILITAMPANPIWVYTSGSSE